MKKKFLSIALVVVICVTLVIVLAGEKESENLDAGISKRDIDRSLDSKTKSESEVGQPTVVIGNREYFIEVAKTEEEQELGLSFRESLDERQGVLFVLESPQKASIWMKDMLFALDIIWISAEKKIVDIKENAKPEDYPDIYSPKGNALYVLEVKAGEIKKNNFRIGDLVVINGLQ